MAGLAPTGASRLARLVVVCAGAALGVGAIAMDGGSQARADAQSGNLTSSVDLWGSPVDGAGQAGCRIVSGGASRITVPSQWVRGQKAVLSGTGWTVVASARAFVSVALDEGKQLRPADRQLPPWAQRSLAEDRQVWDVVELDAQGAFTAAIAVPDDWEAGSRHTVTISDGASGARVTFSVSVVGALTPLRPENCANSPEKPVPAETPSSPSPSPSGPSPSASPSPAPSTPAPSPSVSSSPAPSTPAPSPSASSPSQTPTGPGSAPTISREPSLESRGGARAVEDGAAEGARTPEPAPTTAAPRAAEPSTAPPASEELASAQVPAAPAPPARTQDPLPAAPGGPVRVPQEGDAGSGPADGASGGGSSAVPSQGNAPAARPTTARPSASPSTEPTRVSADAAVPPNAGGGSSEESASGLNSWVMVGGAGLLLLGVTVAFTFIRRMAHPH